MDNEIYGAVQVHLARYYDACDRADYDLIMEILDGATVSVGGLETADPEAIREVYESRQPGPHPDGRRRTKHHMTNLLVSLDSGADGDLVTATTYYLRLGEGETGPAILASGRLVQVLVRDGERWRVRRHTIIADL